MSGDAKGQGLGAPAGLRKANALIAAVMLLLFVFHGVGNAFEIVGVGTPTSKALAWAVVVLAAAHALIGVYLTVLTLRAQRQAKVSYGRLNTRFWAVRISGMAVAVFIVFHMLVFMQLGGGEYRLRPFGGFELATNIGLVVSLAVHVLCSVRPLAVGLGIGAPRARAADLLFVLAVCLLGMAVAFVVYFVRWSVV